jgi:hypothetical protein
VAAAGLKMKEKILSQAGGRSKCFLCGPVRDEARGGTTFSSTATELKGQAQMIRLSDLLMRSTLDGRTDSPKVD